MAAQLELRGGPLASLLWYSKQAPALALYKPGGILIKFGLNQFAYVPSASDFVARWAALVTTTPPLPIYELIPASSTTRLHVDIEGVYSNETPGAIKTWLQALIDGIIAALVTHHPRGAQPAFGDYLVLNGCRRKKGVLKRSFHVIWPNVVFPNNYAALRHFIDTQVLRHTQHLPDAYWTKDGPRGTTRIWAIDKGIYTKNRAFRIPFACKDAHERDYLQPWDTAEWRPLLFASSHARETYIANSLIAVPSPPEGAARFDTVPAEASRRKRPLEKLEKSEATLPTPPTQTPQVKRRMCPRDALIVLRQVLPQLADHRAHDRDTWMRVGWVIHQVCGGSEQGRTLFHEFSQRASNYECKAVDKLYHGCDGSHRLTVATLLHYLKTDEPAALLRILREQERRTLRQAFGMQF